MKERRRPIVWGAILIAVGILALLGSLGLEWVSMESLWPLILVLGGLFSLINAMTQEPRDVDGIWFGVAATLCGLFFGYITLGAGDWRDLQWMWPVFPIIGGVAWLTAWLFDMRQASNLVTGLIAGAVGVGGFFFTLGRMGSGFFGSLSTYWPVILVLLGLGFLVQSFLQRR